MADLKKKIKSLQERVDQLKSLRERAKKIEQYSEEVRVHIEEMIKELMDLSEKDAFNPTAKEIVHSELISDIVDISERMITENESQIDNWKKELENLEKEKSFRLHTFPKE